MPERKGDNSRNPAEAMILVGGKGTRLSSAVSDRPKPMAEVAGRPFVVWLLMRLRAQGVRRIVFCTGHLGDVVEEYFGDGTHWGMELRYSRDPFPLGTGGAVRHGLDQIEGDRFLVLNGDSYCRCDIQMLADVHIRNRAEATLWLVQTDDCRRYGSVLVGADGAVQSFAEKSSVLGCGFINAGVYLIERAAAETIAPGRRVSLEAEFFPGLVGQGLFAAVGRESFIDIGTPESYAGAEQFITEEANAW